MFPIAALADFNPLLFFSKCYPDEDDDGKAHTQPLLKKGRTFLSFSFFAPSVSDLHALFLHDIFRTRCFLECLLLVDYLTFTSTCASVCFSSDDVTSCLLSNTLCLPAGLLLSFPLKVLLQHLSFVLSVCEFI